MTHNLSLGSGFAIVAGVLLALGFQTRLVAFVSAAFWVIGLATSTLPWERELSTVAIMIAIASTLLGGGSLSLDSLYSGRRRIVFPPD